MITKQKETWYVARRGELLAEQFLIDLKPDYITTIQDSHLGFDYVAFFAGPDKSPVAIAVKVKTTERAINGKHTVPAAQLRQLLRGNLPALILVIDVKRNEMYFSWAKDAVPAEQIDTLDNQTSCNMTLRLFTPEEQEKLRREIFEQEAWKPFS